MERTWERQERRGEQEGGGGRSAQQGVSSDGRYRSWNTTTRKATFLIPFEVIDHHRHPPRDLAGINTDAITIHPDDLMTVRHQQNHRSSSTLSSPSVTQESTTTTHIVVTMTRDTSSTDSAHLLSSGSLTFRTPPLNHTVTFPQLVPPASTPSFLWAK